MSDHDARPDRRAFLALGAGAFLVAAFPLVRGRRSALVRRTLPVMGTIAEFAVVAEERRAGHLAIDAAFAELEAVDRAMSRFRADSDVGRLNAAAPGTAVVVGADTAVVLAEALRWAEATEGRFDPCVGRLVELWDVNRRTAPPAPLELRRFAGRRLYRALDVDRWRGQAVARATDAEVGVDLGGIAKGHAVDRAVAVLRARGIRHALVNVGGDLRALGTSPEGDPWRIGVRSASDPSRLSGTLDVQDAAVATSGDYEQRFVYHGHTYHHLLDPRTAAPVASSRHSVTVLAPSCRDADAAATSCFGLAPQAADGLLARAASGARVVAAG